MEKKNHGRDLVVETEEQASMADGVAISEGHQIYLAEAALIHDSKLDKGPKDKFKVVRCMRDSWNCQIRSIARESVPPTGLTIFGSTSFKDEIKFLAVDFLGTYRLRQVGRMLVPLRKSHFASRIETYEDNATYIFDSTQPPPHLPEDAPPTPPDPPGPGANRPDPDPEADRPDKVQVMQQGGEDDAHFLFGYPKKYTIWQAALTKTELPLK
ncbi:hypothetical protein BG005_009511 [Podila minutissima]|nr:hypothetical protein BG005_009511 [Podila minutissima]